MSDSWAMLLERIKDNEAIIARHKVALVAFERSIPALIAENDRLKEDLKVSNFSCAELLEALQYTQLQLLELRDHGRIKEAPCDKCGGTGIIETGNNDLPCQCPAGDKAEFNTAQYGRVSGAFLKARP